MWQRAQGSLRLGREWSKRRVQARAIASGRPLVSTGRRRPSVGTPVEHGDPRGLLRNEGPECYAPRRSQPSARAAALNRLQGRENGAVLTALSGSLPESVLERLASTPQSQRGRWIRCPKPCANGLRMKS